MTQKEVERREACKRVMMLAAMFATECKDWRNCMRQAWANEKLRKRMKQGVVEFTFLKVDGSLRKAHGTLCANLIPGEARGQRRPSPNVQVFYDMDKNEFRSFRKINLVSYANE